MVKGDVLKPNLCGTGYIGYGKYDSKSFTYKIWKCMIEKLFS